MYTVRDCRAAVGATVSRFGPPKEVQMKLIYGVLVAALVGIVVIGTFSSALEAG